MRLYELDIGWVSSERERRYLQWELLACEQVCGVFLTARDDVLAVLFDGDRFEFCAWARSLSTTTTPTRKGAFG
jgi:hypothetical protein